MEKEEGENKTDDEDYDTRREKPTRHQQQEAAEQRETERKTREGETRVMTKNLLHANSRDGETDDDADDGCSCCCSPFYLSISLPPSSYYRVFTLF